MRRRLQMLKSWRLWRRHLSCSSLCFCVVNRNGERGRVCSRLLMRPCLLAEMMALMNKRVLSQHQLPPLLKRQLVSVHEGADERRPEWRQFDRAQTPRDKGQDNRRTNVGSGRRRRTRRSQSQREEETIQKLQRRTAQHQTSTGCKGTVADAHAENPSRVTKRQLLHT
jgi:hypothetical protein